MVNGIFTRINGLLGMFVFICVLIVIWWFIQITTFATFRIPTDSMQPTLQPGDNILVNKCIMGARIFDIWEAAEEKEVEIHHLPGLEKVKRNDVLVFYYTYSHSYDILSKYLQKCLEYKKIR